MTDPIVTPEMIEAGLTFIDGLDRTDRTAFLALFARARSDLTSFDDECPTFGKAECEWPRDWLALYREKLPGAGLTTFEWSEPRPALGMEPGHTFRKVTIQTTALGYAVREAWWKRTRQGEG